MDHQNPAAPRHGCGIEGCPRTRQARGWCGVHYGQWKRTGDPLVPLTDTALARFNAKFVISQVTGCWEWTASRKPAGYGEFHYAAGSERYAHRAAYLLFVGPIPAGMQLDHLCRVRHCVNPDHLEAVSQRENILRSTSPSAMNAQKTHCTHGHELTGRNIYTRQDRPGSRQCRECERIAKRTQQ